MRRARRHPATAFRVETETDTSGSFVFPSLPAGTYDVRVECQGFKTIGQCDRTSGYRANRGEIVARK